MTDTINNTNSHHTTSSTPQPAANPMHYQPIPSPYSLSHTTHNISHTHSNTELYKLLAYSIDRCNGYIQQQCIIHYRYILHKVLIESLFGYVVVGSDINNYQSAVCIKISNKALCEKHQSVRGDNVVDNVKREAAMMYYLQLNELNTCNKQHGSTIQMLDDTDCGSDNSDDDREILCDLSRLSTSSSTVSLHDQHTINNYNTSNSCTPRKHQHNTKSDISNDNHQQQLIQQHKLKYSQYSKYLCKLVGEIEDNETHCLVSEYCNGSDLFDVILRSGALDNNIAIYIFKQLCVAVKYMHTRNIAHLDLSLENICLTSTGEIRLIDFGSAAIHPLDNNSSQLAQYGYSIQPIVQNNNQLVGTNTFPCIPTRRKPGKKAYMSPEIYSGRDGWLGNKNESFDAYSVDIWSLGVILYTMLTGHPPFSVPSPNDDAWFRFIYTGRWLHAESRLKKNSGIYRDVDENALQLINSILKPQHQRPSIDDILNSTWINSINYLNNTQIHKLHKQTQKLAIVQPITLQQQSQSTQKSNNV